MNPWSARNRAHWDRVSAGYQRRHREALARVEPAWGAWPVPEREVGAVGAVRGRRLLEVGCGGGDGALAWARAGAEVVGLDLSPRQLDAARARPGAEGVRWVEGDAEALPFPDRSFDVVISDHGALSFADPARALPEAARVLVPGGRLAFLVTSPWMEVCLDARRGVVGERLCNDYFGLGAMETAEEGWYALGYGQMVRALTAAGLLVRDCVELRAPPGARTRFESFPDPSWAKRWPAELVWVAQTPA